MKLIPYISTIAAAGVLSISQTGLASEILLQGFNWESYQDGLYHKLLNRVDEFKGAGFTAIWLPPPTYSVGDFEPTLHSRGYLPKQYYNLNTAYGSEKQLRTLVSSLNRAGIEPIADIVVNHRGSQGIDSVGCPYFSWPNWGAWALVASEACHGDNKDSGYDTKDFLDLDHKNETVRNNIRDWLKWLRWDVGFSGWRWDFAKGFHAGFVGYYNQETSPTFSVGEYWTNMAHDNDGTLHYDQGAHRQQILNWIDGTWKGITSPQYAAKAFDFTTKGVLQHAIWNKEFWRLGDDQRRPAGVIGAWPEKAVTFLDNHDTASTQRHWVFSDRTDEILQGYAYILTHPGVPTVFWDHYEYFDGKMRGSIRRMMNIRHRNNIEADAKIFIHRVETGLYAATISDCVSMKLGPNSWSPNGNEWLLAESGHDFAIWEKSTCRK